MKNLVISLALLFVSATAFGQTDTIIQPRKDGGKVVIKSVTSGGVATDAVVVDNVGTLKVDKITNKAGTGQPEGGVPAGMIMPYAGSACPTGWLLADGSAVPATTYANLFAAIGTAWGTSSGNVVLPDLRETAPVGVGTRGSGVATHDVYTLGQFKDDQMQGHYHVAGAYRINATAFGASNVAIANSSGTVTNGDTAGPITDGTNGTPRTGAVTRGKRAGVNYCVKY